MGRATVASSQLPSNRSLGGMTVGAWEPFWLGAEDRRLYAALHRTSAPGSRFGLILAPPLLHEQPRSRRLLTELATAFATMGVPSLRFDYFGTGDSAGEGEQLEFASMHHDLQLAVQTLRTSCRVDTIGVLAVRGAALPVLAWARDSGAARLLVLWEPILDGPSWLAELEARDALERRSPKRYPRLVSAVRAQASSSDLQLMGYPASVQLRHDIAQARVESSVLPTRCWGVLRKDAAMQPIALERVFHLPEDVPLIGDAVSMDASVFVTPRLQRMVGELGLALLEEG